jgi:hypothetical protein
MPAFALSVCDHSPGDRMRRVDTVLLSRPGNGSLAVGCWPLSCQPSRCLNRIVSMVPPPPTESQDFFSHNDCHYLRNYSQFTASGSTRNLKVAPRRCSVLQFLSNRPNWSSALQVTVTNPQIHFRMRPGAPVPGWNETHFSGFLTEKPRFVLDSWELSFSVRELHLNWEELRLSRRNRSSHCQLLHAWAAV